MIGRIGNHIKNLFNLDALLRYTEKVSTIGCFVPLLHFAILPFSLFAYVLGEIFGSEYLTNAGTETVTFTVTNKAFYGFFWLAIFWSMAIIAAVILYAMYRVLVRSYAKRPFARVFAKALMAVFVTSGSVERLIANVFMPMALEGSRLPINASLAPTFKISLYRDFGALVRSPMWDLGRYSFTSMYTWIPLIAFSITLLTYLGVRIRNEIRIATRNQ